MSLPYIRLSYYKIMCWPTYAVNDVSHALVSSEKPLKAQGNDPMMKQPQMKHDYPKIVKN